MNNVFLFHLFRPWDWTEGQSSNVINFFAATGTVGALLYAYILERKNSKKINDLANIVTQLAESNQILKEQAVLEKQKMKPFSKPDIRLYHAKENEQRLSVDLTITNEGHYAQNLTYKSAGNVSFFSDVPTTISKGVGLALIGKLDEGVSFAKIFYLIEVRYEDYFGNKYNTIIIGKPNSHRLLQTDDI